MGVQLLNYTQAQLDGFRDHIALTHLQGAPQLNRPPRHTRKLAASVKSSVKYGHLAGEIPCCDPADKFHYLKWRPGRLTQFPRVYERGVTNQPTLPNPMVGVRRISNEVQSVDPVNYPHGPEERLPTNSSEKTDCTFGYFYGFVGSRCIATSACLRYNTLNLPPPLKKPCIVR
jgi:hypothetical protein